MKKFASAFGFLILLGAGCAPQQPPPQVMVPDAPAPTPVTQQPVPKLPFTLLAPEAINTKQVTIATAKGDIVIELLGEQGPLAASNFLSLIDKKFYDGLTFHRRVEGFVIQGGDPQGTGSGGPGYKFADDPIKPIGENPLIAVLPVDMKSRAPANYVLYKRGTVAMANSGPNTNGSQFFIMLDDVPLALSYSVFGRVISGMEVVDKIQVGDKMVRVTAEAAK